MTQSLLGSPNGERPSVVAHRATPTQQPREQLPSHAPPAYRQARVAPRFPVGLVIAACIATHLVAASLAYRDLARDLYALFDAAPRLLVLEHGLARLTATTVFLPPIVPTALVVLVTLWLGKARRHAEVARWLALSLVPLAIDSLLRTVGLLIAPPPATIGELLDLPTRFSLGPRLILELVGIQPPRAMLYWIVVTTVAAVVSAWCVARALLAAEAAASETFGRRRRRAAAIDAAQVGVAVVGTWSALAFAGQVALPWATQLFLKTFG